MQVTTKRDIYLQKPGRKRIRHGEQRSEQATALRALRKALVHGKSNSGAGPTTRDEKGPSLSTTQHRWYAGSVRLSAVWNTAAGRGGHWMRLAVLFSLLASYFCSGISIVAALAETVTVVAVVDGDTVRVRVPGGPTSLVRLIGIDAPERTDNDRARKQAQRQQVELKRILDLGERSTAFVRSKTKPGGQLRLEYDAERYDQYGRVLAYLYLPDGTFLNKEIIRSGYAHLLSYRPNTKYASEFNSAYDEAKAAKRGLWSLMGFSPERRRTHPRSQPWFNR